VPTARPELSVRHIADGGVVDVPHAIWHSLEMSRWGCQSKRPAEGLPLGPVC
jgi:hypothetical protein